MHTAIKPDGVFEPVPGLYSQVIVTRSPVRYEIAGTLPYGPQGQLPESLAEQCRGVMRNIDVSLAAAQLTRANIIRMRVYVTDMDAFIREGVRIVFGNSGDVPPTSTLVQVSRLANPKVLVEIDATAAPFDEPSSSR